ncbi:MAG: hypothetical protein ACR2QC_12040 [Gammaproteobacteria bacterium]
MTASCPLCPIPAKAGISAPKAVIVHTRRFAAAEIPAFAGMGRVGEMEFFVGANPPPRRKNPSAAKITKKNN